MGPAGEAEGVGVDVGIDWLDRMRLKKFIGVVLGSSRRRMPRAA